MTESEHVVFWLQEYAAQLRQNLKSARAAVKIADHLAEDAAADPDEVPQLHDLLVEAALLIRDGSLLLRAV